jgi:hypothetical protein
VKWAKNVARMAETRSVYAQNFVMEGDGPSGSIEVVSWSFEWELNYRLLRWGPLSCRDPYITSKAFDFWKYLIFINLALDPSPWQYVHFDQERVSGRDMEFQGHEKYNEWHMRDGEVQACPKQKQFEEACELLVGYLITLHQLYWARIMRSV